jgi:hypothetical protein
MYDAAHASSSTLNISSESIYSSNEGKSVPHITLCAQRIKQCCYASTLNAAHASSSSSRLTQSHLQK